MTTLSIQDMKERILKPSRASLNAKAVPPAATVDGSRGETHRSLEPGTVAYHPPPPVGPTAPATLPSQPTLHRGVTPLRIPKPSELFGVQSGFLRTPAYPALQSLPPQPVLPTVPQLPPQGLLSAASATRQREHDRRLRSLSVKMQRANLKRRLDAVTRLPSGGEADPQWFGVRDEPLGDESSSSSRSWTGTLLTGLRRWMMTQPPPNLDATSSPVIHETDAGVHLEFDTDVVDALVYTVGRWMGLDTEHLRDSPGLRTLVSRNIQWFRASPDWMKLLGLVLAKKLNHTLDCPRRAPSDTQRMLLDRMMGNTTATSSTEDTATTVQDRSVAVSGSGECVASEMVASESPDAPVVDPGMPPAKRPRTAKKQSTKPATTTKKAPAKDDRTKAKRPTASRKSSPPKTKRHGRRSQPVSIAPPHHPSSADAPQPLSVSLDTAPVVESSAAPSTDPVEPILVEETLYSPPLTEPMPSPAAYWASQ